MLYQACMTLYDHPDRWDGSPSSQYEWSRQHSPKIPVEIVYSSRTEVKTRGRELCAAIE